MSDVYDRILNGNLPALKLGPDHAVGTLAGKTQVFQRADGLGLSLRTLLDFGRNAGLEIDSLLKQRNQPDTCLRNIVYKGKLLSKLNKKLKNNACIDVLSVGLIADEPLRIRNHHQLHINFGKTRLKAGEAAFSKNYHTAAISIDNSKDISVSGGIFKGLEPFVISASARVSIVRTEIIDAPGYGIIVAPANSRILIADAVITRPNASGITVLGKSTDVLIHGNKVSGGRGTSNQHAGILVTDRRIYSQIGGVNFLLAQGVSSDGKPVFHFAPEDPVRNRTPANRVYLIGNEIRDGLANGIYLDGAILTYARRNLVHGNSKEGVCLDNGSAGNIIFGNEVSANGKRWGQRDLDLEMDFVAAFGKDADGDSNAKLPGVSIDNAAFNIVANNYISGNYGSGVKMVRTAFYNILGGNRIESNNAGANDKFFFFGIELGSAPADAPASDLDFTPSQGNVIYQNVITGGHHAGIQFCRDCDFNDIFDNLIVGPEVWAIEQTSPTGRNEFLNNFSLAPSRNANLNGASGKILTGGTGQFD
ncbi:right-handed parallel beta-helix repeat-containing protein [Methylomagnum sp.]